LSEEKMRSNLEIWIKKYQSKCQETNFEFDEPRIRDIIDEWILEIEKKNKQESPAKVIKKE
jgi:hypothetical protein